MRPDLSDPTAPLRGDAISIVGGKSCGGSGTLVRRNGVSAMVVLHPDDRAVVRTLDGRLWTVPRSALVEAKVINPVAVHVFKV